MSIYQEIILDHSRNPHNFGTLKNPTHATDTNNPLCGDKIAMQVEIQDNLIKAIAFTGEGCAISMASASLLTDYAKNKKVSDLIKLDTPFIMTLLGIELSPNRIKCALLPLEALQTLLLKKQK